MKATLYFLALVASTFAGGFVGSLAIPIVYAALERVF